MKTGSQTPASAVSDYTPAFPAGKAAGMPHFIPDEQPQKNVSDWNPSLAEQHLNHFQETKEDKAYLPNKELITKASKPNDTNIKTSEEKQGTTGAIGGMHGVEFIEGHEGQGKTASGSNEKDTANAPPANVNITPNMSGINVIPGQGTGAANQDPQHIAGGYASGHAGGVSTKDMKPLIEEFKASGAPQKEVTTKASRMDDMKLGEGAQPSGNHITGQDADAGKRASAPKGDSNPADKLKSDMHSEVLKHQENAKPDYTRARGEKGQDRNEKGLDKLNDATGYGNSHRIYP